MYEDKKFKLDINWKSLLIKLAILLLIVFLVCFIVFRPKKNNSMISLESNINSVKEAAIEYYKNNFTLKEIGDYDKITLNELIENDYLKKQKDSDGNKCDNKDSYAYLTKIRDNEFVLKINLSCGENEESQVFNLTTKDLTVVASKEEEEVIEVFPEEEEILVENEEIEQEETIIEEEPKTEIANNEEDKEPVKEEDKTSIAINDNNNNCSSNNKVLRYKHIKYGEWTEGNKTGSSIENSTKEVTYYKYCKDGECVIDTVSNMLNYEGYTASYNHKETISIYRYVYVIWSNMCCIEGFVNTGITEYR